MRSIRFSIAVLMLIVLGVALGLAALRNASETVYAVVLLTTRGMLGIALVAAICRPGVARAFWLGFAVLGWVYVSASPGPYLLWPTSPMHYPLQALARIMGIPSDEVYGRHGALDAFIGIGHSIIALLVGGLGGLLACLLFGTGPAPSKATATGTAPPSAASYPYWWVQPLLGLSAGVAIVATIAVFAAKLRPGVWAGLAFFATGLLLGLDAVGGLLGAGRRREAYLGGSVFGAGFLILAFAHSGDGPPPVLPTYQLLADLQRRAPIAATEWSDDPAIAASNARIQEALEKPIPLRFPKETELAEVIRYIKKATAGPKGEVIPVYVDPIGLSEADKSMSSPVIFYGRDGVPLRYSLRRLLAPRGLAYTVESGFLRISSRLRQEQYTLSSPENAYQVAGHCVLAMIAAAFGGLFAPIVCGISGVRRR